MTPEDSKFPNEDPRQALTDALLREHARLGVSDDEALLAAVRARTVDRPGTTHIVDLPTPAAALRRTSAREWMQMAAAVIVTLALVGLFLSRHLVSQQKRSEQTFELVSHPVTAVAVPTESANPNTRKPVPADPSLGEFALPNLEGPLSGSGDLVFAATHGTDPVGEELLAKFSISAEKILRLSPDRLICEGGVILRHPDFTLRADRLELADFDGENEGRVGSFVAEGDALEVEKRGAAGGIEVARAVSATWDSSRGGLVLAGGPPTLSAGGSFVRPASTDGVIVLLTDGYQVIER
ncbi:MAG: hypothetical protein KDN19_12700 [Verrucomicrobiae bacterium]|nr:hypothetical protein [Verrucomicrobiae bacterium]